MGFVETCLWGCALWFVIWGLMVVESLWVFIVLGGLCFICGFTVCLVLVTCLVSIDTVMRPLRGLVFCI